MSGTALKGRRYSDHVIKGIASYVGGTVLFPSAIDYGQLLPGKRRRDISSHAWGLSIASPFSMARYLGTTPQNLVQIPPKNSLMR
jgi:hypothetical protein